jgi:hypothetical protein
VTVDNDGTIQGFIDRGDTLEIWCHSCRHHATIDMMKLRDRLGPDHGSMHDDLIHLFKCSRCGEKRKLGLIRHAKGNDKLVIGDVKRNLYAKMKGG